MKNNPQDLIIAYMFGLATVAFIMAIVCIALEAPKIKHPMNDKE